MLEMRRRAPGAGWPNFKGVVEFLESCGRAHWFIVAGLIFVFTFGYFWRIDFEYVSTRPEMGDSWYYGGCSNSIFQIPGGLHTIHSEAFANIVNVFLFLQDSTPERMNSAGHYAAAERLMTPFAVAVIYRLFLGYVSILNCFLVWNLSLWIAAVLLVYGLAKQLVLSRTATRIMVISFCSEPVFYLMLQSVKSQHLCIVLLLLGMYSYECLRASNASGIRSLLTISALVLLGKYGAGGGVLFGLYLLGRSLMDWRRGNTWRDCAFLFISFWISHAIHSRLSYMMGAVATDYIDIKSILIGTYQYMHAALNSEPLESHKFLGAPGMKFWTTVIPVYVRGILAVNPFVLFLGLWGLVSLQKVRFWLFTPVALLAVNAAVIFVNFWNYVYGYLLFAAFIPVQLGYAEFLGGFYEGRRWIGKAVVVIVLTCSVLWNLMDIWYRPNFHLDRYYGNTNSYAEKKVYEIFSRPSNRNSHPAHGSGHDVQPGIP